MKRATKRWTRVCVWVGAALVAGAVTQTVVAWGCEDRDRRAPRAGVFSGWRDRLMPPDPLTVKVGRREGFGVAELRVWPGEDQPDLCGNCPAPRVSYLSGPAELARSIKPFDLPAFLSALEYQECDSGSATLYFAGWPWLSECRVVHFGFRVGEMANSRSRTLTVWPNLMANSAVYAVAWAVLVGVPIVAIRLVQSRHRIAAGHCPGCGYDTIGLARCPECGLPAAAVQ